jgi:hypothetical protein
LFLRVGRFGGITMKFENLGELKFLLENNLGQEEGWFYLRKNQR